jgi:hypothetical protein
MAILSLSFAFLPADVNNYLDFMEAPDIYSLAF